MGDEKEGSVLSLWEDQIPDSLLTQVFDQLLSFRLDAIDICARWNRLRQRMQHSVGRDQDSLGQTENPKILKITRSNTRILKTLYSHQTSISVGPIADGDELRTYAEQEDVILPNAHSMTRSSRRS